MATESILLSISEKVAQSIKAKNLQGEYPEILKLCRYHNISSFTLHRIIERELALTEGGPSVAETCIGYVRVTTPEISSESVPGYNEAKAALAEDETDGHEYDSDITDNNAQISDTESQKPRKHWFLNFLKAVKRAAVVVICIFLALMFFYLCLQNHNLREENKVYSHTVSCVKTDLMTYEGFQFADWTSTNQDHSSSSSAVYKFYAEKGDRLKAYCRADCESNYDFLRVSVSKGTSDIELAKLSGTKKKHVVYTFPESGVYTFTMRYTKDASVSKGADKCRVSDIFIISSRIDKLREFVDSIISENDL